jgi:hypothetical protein
MIFPTWNNPSLREKGMFFACFFKKNEADCKFFVQSRRLDVIFKE